MAITSRDLPMTLWGTPVVIPKGTILTLVKNGNGLSGDAFAVASKALLVELTGNTHDPEYRWAFVPDDAVEH